MTDFNVVLFTSLPSNIKEDEILDWLFSATNNIDQPWGLNFKLNTHYRSTSVGDIIAIDKKYFVVQPFGFKTVQIKSKEY